MFNNNKYMFHYDDKYLLLIKKLNDFLKKSMRYKKRLSSDDFSITKSCSNEDLTLCFEKRTSNYNKKDRSLDIVRNEDQNYEVVLPYQRIEKNKDLNKKKNKELTISMFNEIHHTNNYDDIDNLETINKADLNF